VIELAAIGGWTGMAQSELYRYLSEGGRLDRPFLASCLDMLSGHVRELATLLRDGGAP
jgi:hypothetical protein